MSELLSFILAHVDGFHRARLPSLYSDFATQRASNPDGFVANQSTWMRALTQASRAGLLPATGSLHNRICIETGEGLLQALEDPQWGRPLALRAVVDEALKKQTIIPYNDFLTSKRSIYTHSWTLHPQWLMSWLVQHLYVFDASNSQQSLPNACFVSLQNLEDVGTSVMANLGKCRGRVEQVIPMEMFEKYVAETMGHQGEPSPLDIAVLLRYLARDKGSIKYNPNVLVVLKHSNDRTDEITSEETTIASLKTSIAQLTTDIDVASESIASLSEAIKDAVSRQNRTLAAAKLRSKKLKERSLAQRTETLIRLGDILQSIEQAVDQITMVKMMEDGAKTLQALHQEIGSIDHVQDVADHVKDEREKVAEIGRVLQDATLDDKMADDEVEEELQTMLQESEAKRDQKELQDLETPRILPEHHLRASQPEDTSTKVSVATQLEDRPAEVESSHEDWQLPNG